MKVKLNSTLERASPYFWIAEIGRVKLGVHEANGWCMQLDDRISSIDSEDRCDPLLPVLELDGPAFFEHLKGIADSNRFLSKFMEDFPTELLLKHAFHSSYSAYWPKRALAWLINDYALQSSLKIELERFADNKLMPQQVRQRVKKILNNL